MAPPRQSKRRQGAALVVQSFFDMGKKSTAQPRPKLHVPPRGIGPVQDLNRNDVLCGRGGRINAHEGNVQFRDIIAANKKHYLAKTTKKLEKAHIAAALVELVRGMNPPGRFLKEDADSGLWFDIGDAKAIKKAGQALREDAPDIRDGDSDDEESPTKAVGSKSKSKSPTRAVDAPKPDMGYAAAENDNRGSRVCPPAGFPVAARGQVRPSTSHSAMPQFVESASAYAVPSSVPYPPQHETYGTPYGVPPPPQQRQQLKANQPSALYNVPRQLCQGVTKGVGNVSKKALEALNAGHHPQTHGYPLEHEDQAFGRHFTPTLLSSGSDAMSTLSGLSGISQADGQFHNKSEISALSMGSHYSGRQGSAHNGGAAPSGPGNQHSGRDSFRVSQLRLSGVSDLTYSFRNMSGMTRSRSFGEYSSRGSSVGSIIREDMPMSDASLVALLKEDVEVGAMGGEHEAVWDATGKATPVVTNPHSSGTSSNSKGSHGSGGGATRNRVFSTSAMSITSMGSGMSDASWLMPNRKLVGSIASENNPWGDDQSQMSDKSDFSYTLMALDLSPGYSLTQR